VQSSLIGHHKHTRDDRMQEEIQARFAHALFRPTLTSSATNPGQKATRLVFHYAKVNSANY